MEPPGPPAGDGRLAAGPADETLRFGLASAAEAEQLDAFDAQLAKAVAAVRERWSN